MCLIYPARPSDRQGDLSKLNLLIMLIGCLSHYVIGSSACASTLGVRKPFNRNASSVFQLQIKWQVLNKTMQRNVKVIIISTALKILKCSLELMVQCSLMFSLLRSFLLRESCSTGFLKVCTESTITQLYLVAQVAFILSVCVRGCS